MTRMMQKLPQQVVPVPKAVSSETEPKMKPEMETVDVLILGAGWTSTFLVPLLVESGVKWCATTRDGRGGTLGFVYGG